MLLDIPVRVFGGDIPAVIKFAKWTVISTQIYVRLTQARHNLLVHASPEAILSKPNHNLAVKRTLRILGKALSQQRIIILFFFLFSARWKRSTRILCEMSFFPGTNNAADINLPVISSRTIAKLLCHVTFLRYIHVAFASRIFLFFRVHTSR